MIAAMKMRIDVSLSMVVGCGLQADAAAFSKAHRSASSEGCRFKEVTQR
jgi:hypothetical protein